MLLVTMIIVVRLRAVMLSVALFYCYSDCYYVACHYAKCHYAECRGACLLVTTFITKTTEPKVETSTQTTFRFSLPSLDDIAYWTVS